MKLSKEEPTPSNALGTAPAWSVIDVVLLGIAALHYIISLSQLFQGRHATSLSMFSGGTLLLLAWLAVRRRRLLLAVILAVMGLAISDSSAVFYAVESVGN
jgi:hypothetical protein